MPDEGRVMVQSHGDGVRIRIPGPRSRWRFAAFVLVVPIAAYVVLVNVVLLRTTISSARLETAGAAAAIWAVTAGLLLLADVPVLAALVVGLYQLTGSETVWATPWMLIDERRVLGVLRYRRSWGSMRVSHLRLSPHSGGIADERLLGRRGVLFVIDGKRVRGVGEGCTPLEASQVLAALDEAITGRRSRASCSPRPRHRGPRAAAGSFVRGARGRAPTA